MKWLYVSFLLLLTAGCMDARAQGDSLNRMKPVMPDCPQAIPLTIYKKTIYGPTHAPQGFGNIQEIRSATPNSKTAFEQEHNTAWYLLQMAFDGEIVFDIIPEDSLNDYDFLLYPCTDSTLFCQQLQQNQVQPLRSNIRRNTIRNKGITGLSATAQAELQAQGPGEQFSRSLKVRKGERYMLVLDNVYPEGKGHRLCFYYIKEVTISGSVVNEAGKPVQADIILSDQQGDTVQRTQSDKEGKYELHPVLHENTNYNLSFLDDSSFISSRIINTRQLKDSVPFIAIRTVLPQLRKGRKYKMDNINFFGGSTRILPESLPSVRSLAMLLKRNKKMTIRIEGHVNAPHDPRPTAEEHQKLSEWRARTVKEQLISEGIDQGRIETIGFAATKMLYPDAVSEQEQSANRRVEINVLSLND